MVRIKELRKRAGISQLELGKLLNVHQTAVSQWEAGRTMPDHQVAMRMAEIFNVSLDYLLGRSENSPKIDVSKIPGAIFPAARAIPILGEICAGNGVDCQECYEGSFFLDGSIRADFALHVKGNSMADEGIADGDVAFFQSFTELQSGEIYAVVLKSENLAKIRQVFQAGEDLILNPRNGADSRYQPERVNCEEVYIAGLYVGVFHHRTH